VHPSDSSALRLIVVEDDGLLRERILLPGLREHGFQAHGVGTAAALQEALRVAVPDLIVLDPGLPDADGFELAPSLRLQLPGVGIVMLTGRRALADQVRGLVDGADAYLVKPVKIELLAATLHSVGRRLADSHAGTAQEHALTGRWQLDADGWRLLAPCGRTMALTRSERPLLHCLIARSGEVVGRDALIALLTGDVHTFDPHRLDSLIHRLRRKISAASGHRFPLLAVHGQGYVFAP